MNLFKKYGIKEVADVVFYSITKVGEDEFYTPVLVLDTLKVSTLEKKAEKVNAKGGKGNKKLITWNFGKEITLNLEDALFSPASMSMIWGGKLNAQLSYITSALVKCNTANKYGQLGYSIKAYPSPTLTDKEWNIIFSMLKTDTPQNRKNAIDAYYLRKVPTAELFNDATGFIPDGGETDNGGTAIAIAEYYKAMSKNAIQGLMNKITTLSDIGSIETDIHEVEVIDRMERCIVKNRNGLKINADRQMKNLYKYYANYQKESFTIFYDAKTMLPLLPIENGNVKKTGDFTIKQGTIYYKWTRTVKYIENSIENSVIGKTFVIDAETFPESYRIVGETYIRDQKTGKDQRYQFVIYNATVSADTSVTLQADGDPTTFSMQIDVNTPSNGIMMEIKQFDVEEDKYEGGTYILPQNKDYNYTVADIEPVTSVDDNDEIY